jgi:hypothetical protein
MRGVAIVAIVSCSACNAIFGLDRTHLGSDGGPGVPDAIPADANPDDLDGDGVANVKDNCPTTYNPDQADEDGDLVGDVCDNCPEVANPGQADVGEVNAGAQADGIGDACDPNPAAAGDVRALFEPFNDPAEVGQHWLMPIGVWTVTGGALVQSDTAALSALAYYQDQRLTDVTVDVQGAFVGTPAPAPDLTAGVWMSLTPPPAPADGMLPDGYLCAIYQAGTANADAEIARWNQQIVGPSQVAVMPYVAAANDPVGFYGAVVTPVTQARCTPSVIGAAVATAITDPKFTATGTVGLNTEHVAFAFRSITVYTH